MKNKIKVIREDKNSEVVVITPLLPGHKISSDTRKTIKRNTTSFTWLSSTGTHNIPTNVKLGLDHYLYTMKGDAKYLLPLDNDIILGRSMIDRLKSTLDKAVDNNDYKTAYSYANFKFQGTINIAFDAYEFDPSRLLQNNYISSNSLINIDDLLSIGGFVTDEKYKRLLDWALWLKFFKAGYIGVPCTNASFIAVATENDVSAGNESDFKLKKNRIYKDFVKPIIDKYVEKTKPPVDQDLEEILSFEGEF